MSTINTATGQDGRKDVPAQLWFADDPCIRTRSAGDRARRLAKQLRYNTPAEPKPTERELFTALYTCAYRANQSGRHAHRRKMWTHRWKTIREYITQQNLGLVYTTVARCPVHEADRDELIGEGMLALTRAVDRYNLFRGFRFSTYACNVIGRAMMRRIKRQSRYRQVFRLQPEEPFDQIKPTDSDASLYAERLKRAMDRNMGCLTDLENHVVAERFLLNRRKPRTYCKIGEDVGLSKERIRQVQNAALAKLRKTLAEDPILK